MKNMICAALGVIGSYIASLFGGWSASITTLCIFMAIDLITGVVCAGIFHKSPKTASGTLASIAGAKGLFKKFTILLFVLIGHRLDLVIGASYIKDMICVAFMANELLSIVENAGLMGIPVPKVITNALDILKKESEDEEDGNNE